MDLYIPYGWTPYEGESHYGVFSTRERAQNVLEKEKKDRYHDNYETMVVQLDERKAF